MTPTATSDTEAKPAETLPITPGEPEHNRRLQALRIAHEIGLISYIGPKTCADGTKCFPVLYGGNAYYLRAEEVLPALYFLAAGEGQSMADQLAYRQDLHA